MDNNSPDTSAEESAVPDRDGFLALLVSMVNASGLAMDITLTVGGLLVSGTMIPAEKFILDFGGKFTADLTDPQSREETLESFKAQADAARLAAESNLPPLFVHLENAQFFMPAGAGPIPQRATGNLWRGRLASVDGWHLGALKNTG